MSQENVEVVRQPIVVGVNSRRRLEERLSLRFPGVFALLVQFVQRLPLRSRLRRALIHRAAQNGFAASNRGDYEAAFAFLHPDCASTFPPELRTIGTEGGTRGREELMSFERRWRAEWGTIRYEPEEIIDLAGQRLLFVERMKGGGLRSGAPIDIEWGLLYTLSAGRVTREQVFFDRGEAVAAAGLSEQDAHADS
jgi:ketosteroid isomerase-like protein